MVEAAGNLILPLSPNLLIKRDLCCEASLCARTFPEGSPGTARSSRFTSLVILLRTGHRHPLFYRDSRRLVAVRGVKRTSHFQFSPIKSCLFRSSFNLGPPARIICGTGPNMRELINRPSTAFRRQLVRRRRCIESLPLYGSTGLQDPEQANRCQEPLLRSHYKSHRIPTRKLKLGFN